MSPLLAGLVILAGLPLSSGVYVRRGSDITDCSQKCRHTDGVLLLYRECGGDEAPLLELWCTNLWLSNHSEDRLRYNTSTGCWALTDAGKDDSCVYNVVYYGDNRRFLTTFPITVLDPVLISTITSKGRRPGEDVAVTVQFSGEMATVTWEVDEGLLPDRYRLIDDNRTVIIPRALRDDTGRRLRVRITNPVSEETWEYRLEITDPGSSHLRFSLQFVAVVAFSVFAAIYVVLEIIIPFIRFIKRRGRKKTETEDVERRTENGGRTNSQTDRPREEEAEIGEKKTSFLIRIHEIWGRIRRIRGYEETPQRDGAEMRSSPLYRRQRPGG